MVKNYVYNTSEEYKKRQLERQNAIDKCICCTKLMHGNINQHLKSEKHKRLVTSDEKLEKVIHRNEKVVCICDCILLKSSLSKHLESEKHKNCLDVKEIKNKSKNTINKEEDLLNKLTLKF